MVVRIEDLIRKSGEMENGDDKSPETVSQPKQSKWNRLKEVKFRNRTKEQEVELEPLTPDEEEAAQYIFGHQDDRSKAARERYAAAYEQMKDKESYNMRYNKVAIGFMKRHPEVFEPDGRDLERDMQEYCELLSDEELSSAYEAFESHQPNAEADYIKLLSEKLEITFGDKIRVERGQEMDGDAWTAQWNDEKRSIGIPENGKFDKLPTRDKMRILGHEMMHAKQFNMMESAMQYVADRIPGAEFGDISQEGNRPNDCDLRFLHFAAARAYEHRHFINNPALARGAMYCMNSRCYTSQDSWEGTSPSHAYNAYRSQIFEAEAYTFDALLKERLDKISPPSYFETEVSPDQKRALQKARREAICRLFSPEDMLAIDDCIHDGSRRIADISDIVAEATNSPINSVRITLRDGQEQKFGYSLPTSCLLIDASNQNEIASPDFRRKYFNNALDFAIQSRAQVLDRFLNDSARAVGADPQEFTPRFIDDYLAKAEEEPTPNLDMIILGIDACVNTQERQAEDTAILIDRMIERANQMPRVKLRYVLNKRRAQLRRKIHGR